MRQTNNTVRQVIRTSVQINSLYEMAAKKKLQISLIATANRNIIEIISSSLTQTMRLEIATRLIFAIRNMEDEFSSFFFSFYNYSHIFSTCRELCAVWYATHTRTHLHASIHVHACRRQRNIDHETVLYTRSKQKLLNALLFGIWFLFWKPLIYYPSVPAAEPIIKNGTCLDVHIGR